MNAELALKWRQRAGATIAVCEPYFERGEALSKQLLNFAGLYGDSVHLSICDDGSTNCPADAIVRDFLEGYMPDFSVSVWRLPAKSESMNPCVPINVAVRESRSRFVFITNPEVTHRMDLLSPVAAELSCDPSRYVVCACWSDRGIWYQHSDHQPFDRHFATALSRETFDAVGGFDERYRDGQAYDDDDFRERLRAAGVPFVRRDDLVTDHWDSIQNKTPLDQRRWMINRALFQRTWPGAPHQ